MSIPRAADLAAATERLRDELAAAAQAVPGVVRLEPTLGNAIRRLHAAATSVLGDGRTVRTAGDGISLHRQADLIDVHVDIVTGPDHPAASTAQNVHDALTATLARNGLEPGAVTVAVLSVER